MVRLIQYRTLVFDFRTLAEFIHNLSKKKKRVLERNVLYHCLFTSIGNGINKSNCITQPARLRNSGGTINFASVLMNTTEANEFNIHMCMYIRTYISVNEMRRCYCRLHKK